MADIIRLLPDHVANQIAAGEVVQRPASVVKELLENAIDAQSKNIKLIVKDGGKMLIQVVDDGIGMSETDARMSFERHATSKIQKAEDLFSLHTKGFRGEALASIAAIAHVEMITRPEGQELATHLKIEGSKVVSQELAVGAQGTSLSIKNLFFNIPARRNFLKSTQVELRHILDEFHRVALAHPAIAFQCYSNGSELFNIPVGSYRKRIVHIFGAKFDEKLVPVNEDTQVAKISGFVCKPHFAKKSRGEQFFFVNDRFVKSPYLHHAVVSAFEGLLKPDVHPGYFLFFQIDPSHIDINIHPTKTEIKFDDEHALYAILRSTIKHALGQFNVVPEIDFEQDPNLNTPYEYKNRVAQLPQVTVDADFNPFKEHKGSVKSSFQKANRTANWEGLYVDMESGFKAPVQEGISFESEVVTGKLFNDKEEVRSGVTFQINQKYIITSIKSGMVVIDQTRAHQRILYEDFLKHMTLQEGVSQQLLFPLNITLDRPDFVVLCEIKEDLIHAGFVFDKMETEEVVISGVPMVLEESNVSGILETILQDHKANIAGDGFSQTDILAKNLAKNLSVKAGKALDSNAQMALVNSLFACKDPQVSPFKKKVFVTLSDREIENLF